MNRSGKKIAGSKKKRVKKRKQEATMVLVSTL